MKNNNNKNRQRFGALIVGIILFVIFILFNQFDAPKPPDEKQDVATLSQQTAPKNHTLAITKPTNIFECKEPLKLINNKRSQWNGSLDEYLNQLVEQGFSVDQVANASLEYWTYRRARNWRRKLLWKEQPKSFWDETVGEIFSEVTRDSFISEVYIDKPVDPKFDNFSHLTQAQKISLINRNALPINEIVQLMNQQQLDDDDLFLLIESAPDNDAMVRDGISFRGYTHILKRLIADKRFHLATRLLNAGLSPAADKFEINEAEILLIAIAQLKPDDHQVILDEALDLFRALTQYGTSVRLTKNEIDRYKIDLHKQAIYRFSSFESQNLDLLIQNGRLTPIIINYLNQIELAEEPAKQLRALYKTEIAEKNPQLMQVAEHCKELEQQIENQWQPEYVDLSDFSLNPQSLTQNEKIRLGQRDPQFLDCLTFQRFAPDIRTYNDNPTQISKEDIVELQQLENTSERINQIYSQILRGDFKQLEALHTANLQPTSFFFRDIQWSRVSTADIEFIQQNGIDMQSFDSQNDSALLYAVKARRLDLITYMKNQGFPFQPIGGKQDPLHFLLASWNHNFEPQFVIEALPLLMEFKPIIDRYHRARMKLIKLQDSKLYHKIVTKYPVLKATQDTPFPQPGCVRY